MNGLSDVQRERLGQLNRAFRAVQHELDAWAPTLPTLEALELELRRLDNLVERAMQADLHATEMHERRDLIDALARQCSQVRTAMKLQPLTQLDEVMRFLRTVVPLAWRGSGVSLPRWLTATWLVMGPDAVELSRVRQVGLETRLLGADVVWLERDDGEVVSFTAERAKELVAALTQRGLPLASSHATARAAEDRLRGLCQQHVQALESVSRNLPRLPDLGPLRRTTELLTDERLGIFKRQNAVTNNEGARLVEEVYRARHKLVAQVDGLLAECGERTGDSTELPVLLARLAPHLPFETRSLGGAILTPQHVVTQQVFRKAGFSCHIKDVVRVERRVNMFDDHATSSPGPGR